MELKFLGATRTVTGSKYLVTTKDKKILLDCGLFQGMKEHRVKNWQPFPIKASSIDTLVLTHAHIDHSGYIPLLVRQGFTGPIYCTEGTRDLCEILLRDCGRIQEDDARRANKYGYTKHKPALPLYTEEEAIKSLKQFKTVKMGEDYPIGEETVFHLSHAGHILGSAIVTFRSKNVRLVFTGDLGRPSNPVMKEPATIQLADYLVCESTYGNRLHVKEDPVETLGKVIERTAKRGGTVLIPAFAVGRSQMVLYLIEQLKEKGRMPHIPVYLDSPMAQDATDIFERHHSEHRLSKKMCEKVCNIAKYVRTTEESKKLHASSMPSVIISASGMLEGGRILHHIKHYAPDPKNTILFSGYQAAMTRGDRILRGESEVKVHGQMIPIRAEVDLLDNLSSHADYEEELDWLKGFKEPPRQVFLTHGESTACDALKEKIEKEFGWGVYVPTYLEEVELSYNAW